MPILYPFIADAVASVDVGDDGNVLRLAHAVLGMAVSESERGVTVDIDIMNGTVCRATNCLQSLKRRKRALTSFLHPEGSTGIALMMAVGELRGRKAANSAL